MNHASSGIAPTAIEPWAAVATYWYEGIAGHR
jgi:hypothetical protein